MEKPAKEITIKLAAVKITGKAYIKMWGGVSSEITMDESTIPIEVADRENILRQVNDGGFGCKKIVFAAVHVDYIYVDDELNHLVKKGYVIETTEEDQKLFLGGE